MNIDEMIAAIEEEELRNNNFLHLTANENIISDTARKFLAAKISDRYFMGAGENGIIDIANFTAMGFKGVENLVETATHAAEKMLGAASVNLNVLSGVHAMMSAILSTTEPGDSVMTVPLEWGGHFATQGIIEATGRKHLLADFDFPNLRFDTEKIAKSFKENNVKALYLDVSYYLNPHNIIELRQALGKDAIIIYDASHTIGLIMGGQFQNPLKEGANIICANTHKTLPGPHKGMIAFRDKDLADKANHIINSSLYSTNHITHLIALSITILEMQEFGKEYAAQIVKNSNAIAEALVSLGYDVRKANTGRYSENHQAHVYIDTKGDRLKIYKNLLENNISTNFQGEELGTRLYIRIGTAEVTRRGMKELEMQQIAGLVDRALQGGEVTEEVASLNSRFTKIFYSFDK
jgi:glycine/serine hydroxymethyltransferase